MEATSVQPRYLRYDQAEQYTGLGKVTIWRAVRDGHLKASGRHTGTRFDVVELDRWMNSRNGDRDL